MNVSVSILTVSDSTVAGTREDASGPALAERCRELGWEIVATGVVPDDEAVIADTLKEWADAGSARLILTTGGTGVAPRDVTPEATRRVLDREIPGLAELMRWKGLEQTKFSIMSRAVAGARKRTLIVNLPGSPDGAVFSLQTIETVIPHTVELLEGNTCHG
jgi:molybdenum cofactor synthesis domain-containing protein